MTSSALAAKAMILSIEGDPMAETRNFTLHLTADTIDTTSRDSDWKRESLQGFQGWSIDFDGLFISGDPAKKCLMAHWEDRTFATVSVILTDANSVTYTGEAILTDFSLDGAYEDAETASGSLQGTGALSISVS